MASKWGSDSLRLDLLGNDKFERYLMSSSLLAERASPIALIVLLKSSKGVAYIIYRPLYILNSLLCLVCLSLWIRVLPMFVLLINIG